MSEEKIMELGKTIIQKQIDLAKVKRDKGKISEVVNLESEIIDLKREFNQELQKISKEVEVTIETDE
jgi:capsule polysaccharide export protein KpsE/RkpR